MMKMEAKETEKHNYFVAKILILCSGVSSEKCKEKEMTGLKMI